MVGLATAWALERRGFACLVFEQGAPGGGQSAGESRIFRHVHEDLRQVDLALWARREWAEWESEFDARLISPDGAMAIGEKATAGLRRFAENPSSEVRELDSDEVCRALPLLAEFDGSALIDDGAGAIRTRLTIANLIGAVGLNLVPEKVESVTPRADGGVEVVSTFGPRVFDAVVVAAGTGTPALAAGAGLSIPLRSRAHVRLTMPLRSSLPAHRLACLEDTSGAFGEWDAYGSPVRGNREYAVGLALEGGSETENAGPDLLAESMERTARYAETALPGLDPSRAVPFQRWVTELPWATDGLAVWQSGEAFFVAGHNLFKLAPALGQVLARAVAEGSVESGFRPEDRLGEPVSGNQEPTAAG